MLFQDQCNLYLLTESARPQYVSKCFNIYKEQKQYEAKVAAYYFHGIISWPTSYMKVFSGDMFCKSTYIID